MSSRVSALPPVDPRDDELIEVLCQRIWEVVRDPAKRATLQAEYPDASPATMMPAVYWPKDWLRATLAIARREGP